MDVYDEEFLKFRAALNKQNVKYIMVWGIATNMNGYQRTTDDIDIWFDDTIENRNKLRTALRNYGMGDYFMLATMQIVPGWTSFNLNNGTKLDLMVNMKGL